MKTRIKELSVAGLMLLSMTLATVVRVVPVGAQTVTGARSACSSMGGSWSYRGSAGAVCTVTASDKTISACQNAGGSFSGGTCTWSSLETSSSSNSNSSTTLTKITASTMISGSSAADVEQKCKNMGGKIGSRGIQQVAANGWTGECIPDSNSGGSNDQNSGDEDGGTGGNNDQNAGGAGTGGNGSNGVERQGYTATGGVQVEDEFSTAILDCGSGSGGEGIFCLLNIALTVLTWGVGIAGTLGIVISGVQYLTARDSAEQMTKAKNRLINIVIGLVVYAVMWGFLNWLIPGGLFN